MKHTDFHSLVQEIKRKEYSELYKAIEVHGENYSWWDDETRSFIDGIDHPIIAVNVDSMFPNPTDIEIRSISINDGNMVFVGEDKESGELVDFNSSDVFAGHLSYIIDLIPETKEVCDVSEPVNEFPLTSISRDDLQAIGYDASDISDSKMKRLASKMSDAYIENGYWIDMDIIADAMGFPRIKNKNKEK